MSSQIDPVAGEQCPTPAAPAADTRPDLAAIRARVDAGWLATLRQDSETLLTEVERLTQELDEANTELMRHQVTGDYEMGQLHANLALERAYRAAVRRAERAEAERDALRHHAVTRAVEAYLSPEDTD